MTRSEDDPAGDGKIKASFSQWKHNQKTIQPAKSSSEYCIRDFRFSFMWHLLSRTPLQINTLFFWGNFDYCYFRFYFNLGMFNVQVLIIVKKKTCTIRTFIFRSSKIFANVSLLLQKYHQGIQNSAINYITWNFLEYNDQVKTWQSMVKIYK